MSVCNCPKCCIFEAKPQIPPMEPVLCTEPLDLVHIDYVSRGQRRKLKNRWGDALYKVVKCVADGIPVYEVENDANKKRQVLHQA